MPKNIQVDKVNDLIQHVRENSDALTAKGADKAALDAHVAKLEAEMRKPEPDHGVISDTLASLETTVGEAEETLEKTGVLRFLNVVFGTGVPNP
jgi:hypothetical protein